MKKLLLFIRCFFGFGSINDGSICEASKLTFIDFHDYHVGSGGDGVVNHFRTYICPKCLKDFKI